MSAAEHKQPYPAAERDLVRRMKSGDPQAFDAFLRDWERPILNLAYRLTGSADNTQDIVQAALLRLFALERKVEGRPLLIGQTRIRAELLEPRAVEPTSIGRPGIPPLLSARRRAWSAQTGAAR